MIDLLVNKREPSCLDWRLVIIFNFESVHDVTKHQ